MKNTKIEWRLGLALLAVQAATAAETNLGSVGQTQLQQDTGDAVQKACGGFVGNVGGLNPAGATPDNTPLWATCRTMVQSGNQVTDNGGDTTFSLDLGEDELAASLQQIATEEFASTESMAAEISSTRMDPVLTRLMAVRAGATGFSVSGLTPESESNWLTADNGYALSGGGAGTDGPGSAFSGFANISGGWGDRESTDRTDAFDFNSFNFTIGVDYRFANNVVVGGALSYYQIESEFDEKPTVSGGDADSDGFGGFVYATWYAENFYVDGMLGYAASSYDLRRNIVIPSNNADLAPISETAKASPDSRDYSVSVGAGYSFYPGAVNWGPYFRATYIDVDIDSYQEKGAEASGLNLEVDGQSWKSFTTTLGAQFAYNFSGNFGVVVPQARLGWIHQFENDATDITAVYVDDPRNNQLTATTDDPDRDYAEFGLGVSAVFKGGSQVFLSYDTLLGLEYLNSHLFTLGGRLEF